MIRFLLDDEEITLGDEVPADLTVLDWLRLHRRRTGTKEGCGSGDCGACTVVAASPVYEHAADGTKQLRQQSPLHYATLNSCITFVGSLHGKQLLTVESLAIGDQLHPVQQAMVDEHGSQCGFCTPGFIMSMYSLYQSCDAQAPSNGWFSAPTPASSNAISDSEAETALHYAIGPPWHTGVIPEKLAAISHRIDRALGGNLCRCTGYRPIKRAMSSALQQRRETESPDQQAALATAQRVTAQRLETLQAKPAVTAGYIQPHTLAEFASFYKANPDAYLLGGGTDLALEVTQQLRTLGPFLSVACVPELQRYESNNESNNSTLELGAGVSLTTCMALLRDVIPDSEQLMLRFGSDQVRNQGTIGGNLGSASPIGDLPPMLLALDASLILQCGDALREQPLHGHFLAYRKTTLQAGEFIRSIRLSLPDAESRFAIYKISKRMEDDISSVCVAIHLRIDQQTDTINFARLAFGGMAATPVRALGTEQFLHGKSLSQQTIDAAGQLLSTDLQPISDARASAGYRLQIAQNLLQRFWLEQSGVATATRLNHHG